MIEQLPLSNSKKTNSDIDIAALSTDASFYKIKPKLIVRPENETEIIAVLNFAKSSKNTITFRAAGTSLSGQALSDSILVDLSHNWKKFYYNDFDNSITAEPGVIGANINKYLKSHGRIIGPDPASIAACMIGGIIANNSSGMRSGINQNAYNSIQSLRFILPGGLIIDTTSPDANQILQKFAPEIYMGLLQIRDDIINDSELSGKITDKYRIKNTVGYSLNSFLDFDNPVDILMHLMIGSEGTLGFITEATLKTFEEKSEKLTGLLFFKNVIDASKAIEPIRNTGVSALEIIDYNSLLSIEDKITDMNLVADIPVGLSALLIEYQESTTAVLEEKRIECETLLKKFDFQYPCILTNDSKLQTRLWSVRKGLLPALGASRRKGTTFILEDICVDVEKFHEVIPALQELFIKWKYFQTGIYGHGMDGNLHFMLTQDFRDESEILRYKNFMDELSRLIINRFNGSLKAEHGTGRNMAPFVKLEWGNKAYEIMKKIKNIIDPANILNPGVIIADDDNIHIKNIKTIPQIDSQLDKCIDCGFCEPVCPSRDYTLTPRKRIAILREFKGNKKELANDLLKDIKFQVNDTCAVDSLCSVACPVGINTGDFVKLLRAENNSKTAEFISKMIAGNFRLLEYPGIILIRTIHGLNGQFMKNCLNKFSDKLGKYIFNKNLYKWNQYIGKPAELIRNKQNEKDFIYFPACVSRFMGKPNDVNLPSITEVMQEISASAGLKLFIPANIRNYCCGTIFSSKGLNKAAEISANRLVEFLWVQSVQGKFPVIIDSTSCYQTIFTFRYKLTEENAKKYDSMQFLDSALFIEKYIIPNIDIANKKLKVVLHPSCSAVKHDISESLLRIAGACADEVVVPVNSGCCGMAGDRGLMFPELTVNATKFEAEEIEHQDADGYYSSNIPCEIAMSSATNRQYLSIAYLVKDAIKKY